MKRILTTLLLITILCNLSAQIKAVTETGDEVLLYQDGNWKYLNDINLTNENEVPINEVKFEKDSKSTFLVKSKKLNIGIWLDPKKWSFTKSEDNEAAEFKFQKKGEDLYAMLVSEKIEISIESLKEIAFNNAKKAAPDIRIVNEEYRYVNGLKVLQMQMTGTIQSIKFTYYGYYFSNKNGTIQFLSYTSNNLFKDYQPEIEKFLNGLVELAN